MESLEDRLRGRGWQPSRAEMESLFDELGEHDREQAELVVRALLRRGKEAGEEAVRRFAASRPPQRGRLVKLAGRLGAPFLDFLLAALEDDDAKSRRNAVIALGKIGGDVVQAQLLQRWPKAALEERRSLAEALGKIGGPAALALLESAASDDPELARILGEARLKLSRTLARADSGGFDAEALPPRALTVAFHCREGVATILAAEIEQRLGRAQIADRETVTAVLAKPLSALLSVRTALYFSFPLAAPGKDVGDAVVAALSGEPARAVFAAFTRGPVRYRLEWASAGKRRGLTFRTAERIARARPELLNDPTASLWEAIVDESQGVRVELWPRGLEDRRFAYRIEQVPASSHPTLAAALARIGGIREDDFVWDPFAGGGTELVERARLGPFKRLYGTDLDDAALARAHTNLGAAGVTAELAVADARRHRPPEPPTLIITNPPMGRRVLNKELTGALYDQFLAHAQQQLAPGGRLVWISPRADDTAARARQLGLTQLLRQRVDMAGFWAELQAFKK